jgi:hypothetical protein
MKDTITSRGVTFPRPSTDEKSEQAQIVTLVETLGGRAYVLGSRRAQYCGLCGARNGDQGTRQTEGLGDLAVYLPPRPRLRDLGSSWTFLWVECKGRGGTLSPEQVAFRQINEQARVAHIVGGLDAVLAWLEAGGWVKA